jgi:hypothetical protein
MRFGSRILLLGLLAGCAGTEKPPLNSAPIAIAQGASLKPLLAQRVQVRGYLLNDRYKGFPHLYGNPKTEESTSFLLSIPDSISWRSRLHRELVVVGIVEERLPFTKEQQRDPETVPQGYPEGAIFIRVETMEDAATK